MSQFDEFTCSNLDLSTLSMVIFSVWANARLVVLATRRAPPVGQLICKTMAASIVARLSPVPSGGGSFGI